MSEFKNTYVCQYCGKLCKNANSLRNHERLCKQNPNRQYSYFSLHRGKTITWTPENRYTKAKKLGLPKPQLSEETRQKLSNAIKKRTPDFLAENAKKISKTVKRKVANGTWHNSRGKKYVVEYKGIKFDSSWEVAYAKFLDSKNIRWKRNTDSFCYFWNNENHNYTPDFYLVDTNEYVEIKGWEQERDRAKWSQFPTDKTLIILKEEDLKRLGIAL